MHIEIGYDVKPAIGMSHVVSTHVLKISGEQVISGYLDVVEQIWIHGVDSILPDSIAYITISK